MTASSAIAVASAHGFWPKRPRRWGAHSGWRAGLGDVGHGRSYGACSEVCQRPEPRPATVFSASSSARKSAGGVGVEGQRHAAAWMGEGEAGRMQRLAREIQQLRAHRRRQALGDGGNAPQIDRVADHGMGCIREMDADLMRPSGGELHVEERYGQPPDLQRGVMGERAASAVGADRHALAVAGVAPDRAFDIAGGRAHRAPAQREIMAVEVAIGEGLGEARMGEFGLRRHHDAGSFLVEPVDDAGPALAADAGEAVAAMGEQRVDQRPLVIAGAGCTTRPAGLSSTTRSASS